MIAQDVLQNSSAVINVDLNAIINNYQILSGRSSSADCAAVVKANAYGMGLEHVASAIFYNTKCKIFFVANLKEAVALRSSIKDAIIYVFNGLFPDQIECYLDHNIRPVLNDLSQIKMWQGKAEPCAIHFDTGINRLGLSDQQTEQFLNSETNLNLALILSHLIASDLPDDADNKIQLNKFKKITDALPDVPASLCNSAGIYLGKDYHFNLLRPGIMLYGGNPRALALPQGIKPVFEIMGKILQIRHLETGSSVGYNALWTAKKPSRIALINVGYADGYLKLNDNRGLVFVCDQIVAVIGKVSMDMIAIDITGHEFDKLMPEDEVELIGKNITLEMASEVSTLGHYELLTSVRDRVYRNYKLEADT